MTKRRVTLPNWISVEVQSCADGTMQVIPVWRGIKPYDDQNGGGPGLITRTMAAEELQNFLNVALAKRRKP